LVLKCKDAVPPPATLTFVDNCVDDIEVTAIEEDAGGSVCEGKKTLRRWQGAHDDCGNVASTVFQMVTVIDQEDPVLPDTIEDLSFTCPRDFAIDNLKLPTATDDCDDVVIVTKTVFHPEVCGNATVTWTATDECGKQSSLNQTVRHHETTFVLYQPRFTHVFSYPYN
jgi:hypothetical protein